MSPGSSPFKEQRRGRRYRYRLPVDLHSQAGKKRLWTHDVGAHGIFLLMNEPPRERHVLKLTIYLPEGPVGTVAHGTHTSPRGMGAQFFALSRDAKQRWDRFLSELAGEKTPQQEAREGEEDLPETATFVVKLKTKEALKEFVDHCVSAGGTYLRTPVLKAVGSQVTLTMVHPVTERDFALAGQVVRLHQKRPKGMEIHFTKGTLAQASSFQEFIESGEHADINIDEENDLVLETSDEFAIPTATTSPPPEPAPAPAPAAARDEEDVLFDIDVFDDTVVEKTPLSEEEQFEWIDVEDELLIDTGIPDATDTFALPNTDPEGEAEQTGPVPVSQEGHPMPGSLPDLSEATRPFMQVTVSCDKCDMLDTEIDAGGAPGVLGAVARLRPYFCPSCQMIVSLRRPLPAADRARVREKLDESDALEAHVPLRLLFDVASLDEPLRCPTCDTKLKTTKATKALEHAIDKIEAGEDPADVEVPCALCREGRWSVEHVVPPVRTAETGAPEPGESEPED